MDTDLTAAAVVAALEDAQSDEELAKVRKRVRAGEPAIGVHMGRLFEIAKANQHLRLAEIERLPASLAATSPRARPSRRTISPPRPIRSGVARPSPLPSSSSATATTTT